MQPIHPTLFSFGYWGWGTHARELVKVVDAAEKSAGFKPPTWVDIRLKRQGRARDFVGNAFEQIVGADRYKWMPELGNSNIGTENLEIKIKQPEAAIDLLDIALKAASTKRRVIFYCACEFPSSCHRRVVAKLLKKEAKRHGISLSVPDWPVGKPIEVEIAGSDALARQIARGTKRTLLLPDNRPDLRVLPHGSIVTLKGETESAYMTTGPANFQNGWYLAPLNLRPVATLAGARSSAQTTRQLLGFNFE